MAAKQGDFYYIVDLPALMAMVEKGTRWKELKASDAFATSKSVLVNSTDVRTSNSAAMYLALASYLANNQQIVQSQEARVSRNNRRPVRSKTISLWAWARRRCSWPTSRRWWSFGSRTPTN
jgi:hypothetical protein